ncbi:MAG: hypothetical protein LQ339_008656 [Xanthoria mediterranea]|nr:MAG: hypothetical protein LQ339_008656 [Xanthoria mediterranea]
MPQQRKLRSRQHKIQGMSDAEQATLIQATLNNFPRQTRATARVIKQNAMEAGLIQPEMKPTPRKPVRVTRIVSIGSEDSDSELEFTFESDRKAMNPWRQVSRSESARAWRAWEAEHDSLDQLLRYPNYNVGSARPPRPILMKDLASSTDTYGIDSPVTFEPDLRQWRAFEVLISHLQEYANGREDGFVKVKVPEGALIPVVGATHFVKEVPTINHRIRLDRLPKHNNCVTKGIYRVKLSSNHYQDSTLTWRAILDDYESQCRKDVIVASDARKNERLETLAKIHYQRQEQDAVRRKDEDDPVGSIAQRVRDAQIGRRRLLSNNGSTQINPTSKSSEITASRDQIGTDGGSSNPHSSSTPSKEPTDSEDGTVLDGRSESDDQSVDSRNACPTRSKPSPEPTPPFTEDVMLSLPGRHQSMIYSPNNTGTNPSQHPNDLSPTQTS